MTAEDRTLPQTRETQQALELAREARSQFLANMSHELRTPIHGILSFAEFGMREVETATREELGQYFQQVHESGTVLLGLVDELVDLAKLEAGRMVFNMAPVDVAGLALDFVSELQERFEEKRLRLEIEEPQGDALVEGDALRLAQALRHLLGNTLRNARSAVGVRLDEGADGSVTIAIHDDRPPLSPEEVNQLFDPLAQSRRTGQKTRGTELGLPIAREIVVAHHGSIAVESAAGRTTFIVHLPRRHAGGRANAA